MKQMKKITLLAAAILLLAALTVDVYDQILHLLSPFRNDCSDTVICAAPKMIMRSTAG